mmetsp:Transcript_45630/g.120666  ORF Transcript_45630/g.120666 Transcript_45630/m.120666 type:complete len:603 (+) Transcript_45630:45-1853(+)
MHANGASSHGSEADASEVDTKSCDTAAAPAAEAGEDSKDDAVGQPAEERGSPGASTESGVSEPAVEGSEASGCTAASGAGGEEEAAQPPVGSDDEVGAAVAQDVSHPSPVTAVLQRRMPTKEEVQEALQELSDADLRRMAERLAASVDHVQHHFEELMAESAELKEEHSKRTETVTVMLQCTKNLAIARENTVAPAINETPVAFVHRLLRQQAAKRGVTTVPVERVSCNVGELRRHPALDRNAPMENARERATDLYSDVRTTVRSTVEDTLGDEALEQLREARIRAGIAVVSARHLAEQQAEKAAQVARVTAQQTKEQAAAAASVAKQTARQTREQAVALGRETSDTAFAIAADVGSALGSAWSSFGKMLAPPVKPVRKKKRRAVAGPAAGPDQPSEPQAGTRVGQRVLPSRQPQRQIPQPTAPLSGGLWDESDMMDTFQPPARGVAADKAVPPNHHQRAAEAVGLSHDQASATPQPRRPTSPAPPPLEAPTLTPREVAAPVHDSLPMGCPTASPGSAMGDEGASVLLRVEMDMGNGSVVPVVVTDRDDCDSAAAAFGSVHNLPEQSVAALAAFLSHIEDEAESFPVEVQAVLTKIVKQYGQ